MRNATLSVLMLALCASAFGADAEAVKAKPYTLDTCAVSGEKLGDMGDAVVKVYKGQEVKFCCNGCIKKFEKDIDGNLKKLNTDMEKVAADKAKEPADKSKAPADKAKAPADKSDHAGHDHAK